MDGTELENFVADLERLLLPAGFRVELRRRQYNADGVQLAEFDVIVSGRLGSTPVQWLIECRDRPSEGPAAGAWIEQLVGRRTRFHFDKVMAVSTTGFAPGASEFAREQGIELRTVTRLTPTDVLDWFAAEEFTLCTRAIHLTYAKIVISDTESAERQAAATLAARVPLEEPTLFRPDTQALVRPLDAFVIAVARRPELWPADPTCEWSSDVEINANYPTNSRYELDTPLGRIPIPSILFRGTLSIHVRHIPFSRFLDYGDELTGERIVTSVAADFTLDEQAVRVSLERVTVDGTERLAVRMTRRT